MPAGVTLIALELWGPGGGGASGGGGSGGMYVLGVFDVSPGITLIITPGFGGSAASSESGSGGNGSRTTVSGSGVFLDAVGGGGALSYTPGYSGIFSSSGSPFIQLIGQNGGANSITYA